MKNVFRVCKKEESARERSQEKNNFPRNHCDTLYYTAVQQHHNFITVTLSS